VLNSYLCNLIFDLLLSLSDSFVQVAHSIVQSRIHQSLGLFEFEVSLCAKVENILSKVLNAGEDLFRGCIVGEIQNFLFEFCQLAYRCSRYRDLELNHTAQIQQRYFILILTFEILLRVEIKKDPQREDEDGVEALMR
jgi:hypothetical protein